ncbi:cell wall-binding repeat-containing protein [Paenisporosarcina antarctica]|uniref:Peptidase S8 n=1 Tax=Paenisporosarcina antarctica TaxID=417367 RepID=A0A4P7A1V3_9BACL|nr:cell wall-binding repeat-containing protein [Paenisporosarcina antarctica]QBP42584.1 peptidase S8 [Paenisporosarcina antarctica]
MNKKKFTRLMVVILISVIFFSQLSLKEVKAAEATVPKEETTLTISSPVEGIFESSEQIHWYKVNPTEGEITDFTHLRMKLQSEQELNIIIFSSLENAIENRAFDRYMGYSYQNQPAIIDFPIAWVGPYYIKVEYYGEENSESEIEQPQNLDPVTPYTISYDGVTLPPTNPVAEGTEECPVELSTKQRENGKNILKDLRTIRENILAKTDKGKDLSAMYYKMAPFLSSKMVFSKTLRENVYNDLMQLKGLFTDVAANGSASAYKITKEDQKSINNLYETSLESVPDFLKDQILKTGKSIDISNLTNKTVSSILTKGGFAKSNVSSNENRLIVKIKDGKKLSNILPKTKSFGIESITPFEAKGSVFPNMYVMEVGGSSSDFNVSSNTLKATSKQVSKLSDVEFVEPVQQYHALSADSQFPYQWSLKNDGSSLGIPDADIQFEKLQELLKGKQMKDSIIAVLDTGVDHTLSDLSGSVLANSGYDFINNSSNAMDGNGHGTHVSGIIAAEANNQYSMAGINAYTKILPVKVLDDSGSGDTEQIAYGIKYAVDNGANVINLSLGGSYSRVLEYALKYANDHDVTVVAASGNDGYEEISYPASSQYAISVGATNRLDIVSDYSNFGSGLDLVAPGTEIPSLMPDGNVTIMSGTSMATPHVAAVAGLLLSRNSELLPSEIEKILTKTASDVTFDEQDNPGDDIGYYPIDEEDPYPIEEPVPGYDNVSGWGRLDANSAVSYLDKKEVSMERIFGTDRYKTAVNVSTKGWDISDVAVIATGRNYPDALSATPLAYKNKAPLLLTNTNALPATVKAELKRLKVKKVILVGGKSAIATNVEKDIIGLGITNISRISGANRYETSVNIAKQLGSTDQAVVVTGESFADALSIAPIAASLKMPILLTKKNTLPDSVSQYVKSSKFKQTFVIGGTSVVPNKIANGLPNHKRISGTTRYDTNSSIITYFANELDMTSPFIATGSNYPDALSSSALAAVQGNPLILTNPSVVQQTTKNTISKYADLAEKYYIIGGEIALPKSLVESLFE